MGREFRALWLRITTVGVLAAAWGCAAEVEEQVAIDSSEQALIACSATDLSWDATQATAGSRLCDGPWQYETGGECTSTKTVCTEYEECKDWSFGEGAPSELRDTKQWNVKTNCKCDDPTGPKGSCLAWLCRADQADYAAKQPLCDQFARERLAARKNGVKIEWSLPAVKSERAIGSLELVRTYSKPNGVADYGAKCTATTSFTTPKADKKAPCKCLKSEDQCTAYSPVTQSYSEPGQPFSSVPSQARNVSCTSCEHVPLRSSADASSMFACLAERDSDRYPEAVRAVARRHVTELFELYGDGLSSEAYQSARMTHRTDAALLSCGAAALSMNWTCVSATQRASLEAALPACARLTAPHVSPGVFKAEVSSCLDVISDYWNASGSCTPEARAPVVTLTNAMGKQIAELLRDQGSDVKALGQVLALIDRWYAAVEAQEGGAPAPALARTSPVFEVLWSHAYASTLSELRLSRQAGPSELSSGLARALGNRRQAELAIIAAAFADDAPMKRAPLVMLLGDALTPLAEGIEQRARVHDVACQFTSDCADGKVTGELVAVLKLMQSLLSEQELGAALQRDKAALPVDLYDAFDAIRARHQALRAAYGGLAGRPASLSELRKITAPRGAERMQALVARADASLGRYVREGLFHMASHALHVGVDASVRGNVLTRMETLLTNLDNQNQKYRAEQRQLVDVLLSKIDRQERADAVNDRALRIIKDLRDAHADLEGLRARESTELLRAADIEGRVHALFTEQDENGALGFRANADALSITAQNARYDGKTYDLLGSIAVEHDGGVYKLSVSARDRVRISASGQWSPSCAIRKYMPGTNMLAFADKQGDKGSDPMTGPEGYWLEGSTSSATVRSIFANSERFSRTESTTSICANAKGGLDVIGNGGGVSFNYCQSTSTGQSESNGTSNTTAHEQRNSAHFSTGLRVPGVPFASAPAGALLLVAMEPGASARDKIRNVYVVTPGRSFLFSQAADLYFVVNDSNLCDGLSDSPLTVDVEHLVPMGAVAERFSAAQANVLSDFAEQTQGLLNQGNLLSSDLSALRTRAYHKLGTTLGNDVSVLPPAIDTYFRAFVEAQLASIERKARMLAIERELVRLKVDSDAMAREVERGAESSRLGALLLRYKLLDLAAPELEGVLKEYVELVADIAQPVLKLRYPNVLASFADDADLRKLRSVTVDAPLDEQIDVVIRFGKTLKDRLQKYVEPSESSLVATLAIPRPFTDPEEYANFRAVDETRAAAFWRAIDAGDRAVLDITAADLYESVTMPPSGDVLPCERTSPIIQGMSVLAVAPDDPGASGWNASTWTMKAAAAPHMMFPEARGPLEYDLSPISGAEPGSEQNWLVATPTLTFANRARSMAELVNVPTNTEARGISPLTRFEMWMVNPNRTYLERTQVLLVSFGVMTRKAGTGLSSWMPSCPEYKAPTTPPALRIDSPRPEAPVEPTKMATNTSLIRKKPVPVKIICDQLH